MINCLQPEILGLVFTFCDSTQVLYLLSTCSKYRTMLKSFNSLCDMMSCTLYVNHAYTEARSRRDMKKICKVALLLCVDIPSLCLMLTCFRSEVMCRMTNAGNPDCVSALLETGKYDHDVKVKERCLEIACARGHDNCASLFLRRPGARCICYALSYTPANLVTSGAFAHCSRRVHEFFLQTTFSLLFGMAVSHVLSHVLSCWSRMLM